MYIDLIMNAQLNIKGRAFHSIDTRENADNAKTPDWGRVSDWGWKNSPGLELA